MSESIVITKASTDLSILKQWTNTAKVYTNTLTRGQVVELLTYLEKEYRLMDGHTAMDFLSKSTMGEELYSIEVAVSNNIAVSIGWFIAVYQTPTTTQPLFSYDHILA